MVSRGEGRREGKTGGKRGKRQIYSREVG